MPFACIDLRYPSLPRYGISPPGHLFTAGLGSAGSTKKKNCFAYVPQTIYVAFAMVTRRAVHMVRSLSFSLHTQQKGLCVVLCCAGFLPSLPSRLLSRAHTPHHAPPLRRSPLNPTYLQRMLEETLQHKGRLARSLAATPQLTTTTNTQPNQGAKQSGAPGSGSTPARPTSVLQENGAESFTTA